MAVDNLIYVCECGYRFPVEHYALEVKVFCPRCQETHSVPYSNLERQVDAEITRVAETPFTEEDLPSTPVALPDGYQSELFSYLPPESSTTPPQHWSIVLGKLPDRLALNPVSGRILGRLSPDSSGKYYWALRCVTKGQDAPPRYFAYSLTVREARPLVLETMHLFPAQEGEFYQTKFESSGGIHPYLWDIAEGDLPAGFRFDGERGLLFGVPFVEAIGLHRMRVRARDSSKPPLIVQRLFLLQVKPRADFEFVTQELPPIKANTPYTFESTARGGKEPYIWRLVAGKLPQGIEFLSGQGRLTGLARPEDIGTYRIKIEASDSQRPAQASSREFKLVLVKEKPLEVKAEDLIESVAGRHYEHELSASGGKPPYRWKLARGRLPEGLQLNATNGRITGSPVKESIGRYAFAISVSDSQDKREETEQEFQLSVVPSMLLEIVTPPTILDLPREDRFLHQLMAEGGRPPYTWKVIEGELPGNLSLDPNTGMISGIAGFFPSSGARIVVQVVDTNEEPSRVTKEINLFPEPLPQISSFIASMPDGTEVFIEGVLKSARVERHGEKGIFDEKTRLKLYRSAGPLVFSFFPRVECDLTRMKVSYILGTDKPEEEEKKKDEEKSEKEHPEEKVIRLNSLMLEMEHLEGLASRILGFSSRALHREVREFTGRVQGKVHIGRYVRYKLQRKVPQVYPCIVNRESADTVENKYLVALLNLLSSEINNLLTDVDEASPHFQRLARHYGHLKNFLKAKELKGLSFYRRIQAADDPGLEQLRQASERRVKKRLIGRGTPLYASLLDWFDKFKNWYFNRARWIVTETLGFGPRFDRTLWQLWVLELLGETISQQAGGTMHRRPVDERRENAVYSIDSVNGPIEMWYVSDGVEAPGWQKFLNGKSGAISSHIDPSCDFICVNRSEKGEPLGLVFGIVSPEVRDEEGDVNNEVYRMLGHLYIAQHAGLPASGLIVYRSNNGSWMRKFSGDMTGGLNVMAVGVSAKEATTEQFGEPAKYVSGTAAI
ncbi:MAG: Ig domain-containing protein [Planctomycetota bacterium]|jgi:hypothetical protein